MNCVVDQKPFIKMPLILLKALVEQESQHSVKQNFADILSSLEDLKNGPKVPIWDLVWHIRQSVKDIEKGYRRRLYKEIAHAAALGLHLRENSTHWEDFCLPDNWEGTSERPPKPDDQSRAVYHVLRFILADCLNTKKDASLYDHAIRPLIDDGMCSPMLAHPHTQHLCIMR